MSKILHATRKLLAALVGFPVLLLGLVLIPLPGPGLLICLLALFILSTEFDWTKRYFDSIKDRFKQIYHDAQLKMPKE